MRVLKTLCFGSSNQYMLINGSLLNLLRRNGLEVTGHRDIHSYINGFGNTLLESAGSTSLR